jgi:hypothetical protein
MCINLVLEYPRLVDYAGVETEVLIVRGNLVFLEVGEHFSDELFDVGAGTRDKSQVVAGQLWGSVAQELFEAYVDEYCTMIRMNVFIE